MSSILLNYQNTAVDTPEPAYTNPSSDTAVLIESYTASNTGGVSGDYSAYITTSAESATLPLINKQVVVWGEIDLGIGLVNHCIPPNGKLWIESSDTNITHTVTGKAV
jgi:hypothetical protein